MKITIIVLTNLVIIVAVVLLLTFVCGVGQSRNSKGDDEQAKAVGQMKKDK